MRGIGAIAVVALLASVASADPGARLAEAQRHFDDLDYEQVLPVADGVIGDRSATPDQKARAYYVRGAALVVLERDQQASADFTAMLSIDPDARPPSDAPPRIRAAFESTRAAWRVKLEEELSTRLGAQLRDVKLEVKAPPNAKGGRPLSVHVRLADPHGLANRVVLGYRRADQHEFSLVSAPASGTFELAIPGAVLSSKKPYRLAWYVQALHSSGAVLRHEGDDGEPRWLDIAAGQPPGPRSIASRWWFWAGMVTLAASAVAVPYLIDRAHDIGPQRVTVGP